MSESPESLFIRTFRTRWLWPGLPPKQTPEQEQERGTEQDEARGDLAAMIRRHRAALEPGRWTKMRRRLRSFFR